MKRSDFIKGIVGLLGLTVLPNSVAIKQFRRIYLLKSFIRGFQYYEGLTLLNEMKERQLLELVREHDNQYDDCAIALHYNSRKIGFLPMEDNEMLSKLMDAELLQLQAEITHINKQAKSWENVHVAVYVLKEIHEPLPTTVAYLTSLETPRYLSLKINNDRIVNLYNDFEMDKDDDILDADLFYKTMVNNSKDDGIYDVLHTQFGRGENLQQIITDGRMIVNEKRLPDDLKSDELIEAIENIPVKLDMLFDEDGYLVANVNRVANLSHRLENVSKIIDKHGREFFEIIYN